MIPRAGLEQNQLSPSALVTGIPNLADGNCHFLHGDAWEQAGWLPVIAARVGGSVSPCQPGGQEGSKRSFCCFSSCLLRWEGPEPLPAAIGEGSPLSAAASFGSRPSPFTQWATGGTLARPAHPFPSAGAYETLHGGESGGRARFPHSGVLARPSSSPAVKNRWNGGPSTIPLGRERMGYRLNRTPP